MTTALAIRTILEIAVSLFVIYCVYNEQKIIVIEDRIIKYIAKKIYIRKRKKAIAKKKAAKRAQAARRQAVRSEEYSPKPARKVYDINFAA